MAAAIRTFEAPAYDTDIALRLKTAVASCQLSDQ